LQSRRLLELLCGDEAHFDCDDDDESLTALHIAHLVGRDPSPARFAKLPVNRAALRDKSGVWRIDFDIDEAYEPQDDDIFGLSPREIEAFAVDASSSGVLVLKNCDGLTTKGRYRRARYRRAFSSEVDSGSR
jgi:hypothetical protein